MPLSWNEIRNRAQAFAARWKDADSEQAQSQHFWIEFFAVFGVDPKRVSMFERRVKLSRAGERLREGRIDLFWPGTLLVEMKSPGQDLDRAFRQASDYFEALPDRDLPRYLLVCDFRTFRLYDLHEGIDHPPFALPQFRDRVNLFGFIAGYQVQVIRPQDPVNIRAAEQMGRLHDLLKASGYVGHPLELLLVRLLFCLFADDTGIFQPAQSFRAWLEERTSPDGSDLGPQLAQLFQVLNQQEHTRPRTLDEQLRAFPFVNGKLFEETLPIASFDGQMRESRSRVRLWQLPRCQLSGAAYARARCASRIARARAQDWPAACRHPATHQRRRRPVPRDRDRGIPSADRAGGAVVG